MKDEMACSRARRMIEERSSVRRVLIVFSLSILAALNLYANTAYARDGYSQQEIDLFVEWLFEENDDFAHVTKTAYGREQSIFLAVINSRQILDHIDKTLTQLHYHVAGIPVHFIELDELDDELLLARITEIEEKNTLYTVHPFLIFMDSDKNNAAGIAEHTMKRFSVQPHTVSEDTYTLSEECEIRRYRQHYKVYQTVVFSENASNTSQKVACMFTGLYVALGLSNADAIFNSPYVMSRVGESGYVPGYGFHPLNMLYKGVEGTEIRTGSTRQDLQLD